MASNEPPRPTEPAAETPTDTWARRLRERMAAYIAGAIVLSFLVLTILAFFYTSDSNAFSRAKDLLLFINPVVGVVIGFYFNKASTEARAESAEKTARAASDTAQQAVQERAEATAQAAQATAQATQAAQVATQADQARQEAVQQTQAAEQKADEAVSLLNDVSASAQAVLSPPAPSGGVLGGPSSNESAEAARKRLEDALKRARDSGLLSAK